MGKPKGPKEPKSPEEVREQARRKDWKVTRGKKYYMMWCPNPCKCKKSVKCTPSNPDYTKNLLGELRRKTCWDEGESR